LKIKKRKDEHIRISLKRPVNTESNWHEVHLIHSCVPEVNLDSIDTSCNFLGHKLSAPLLVSSITGGMKLGMKINKNIARACQNLGLGMGVGSQRIAIENPELAETFQVRDVAPDIFLYGNVGAVQLNYGYWAEHVEKAIDMIQADAVALHLNPLHEAIQPEGDRNFENLLPRIKDVTRIKKPVIAKETGAGISRENALALKKVNVSALMVDGKGGTSFSKVEGFRGGRMIDLFGEWGIPTPISVMECRDILPVVSGGGVRNGLHMAKSIALGAELCQMALPPLAPAMRSYREVEDFLKQKIDEFKTAMFLTGSGSVRELKKKKTVLSGFVLEWANQRIYSG
jgi:isopentenyl-diphosphate delta-isomerase